MIHNFVPEHTYENVDACFPSPSMFNRRVVQLQSQSHLDQSQFYQYSQTNSIIKRSLPNILQDDAVGNDTPETHRRFIPKQRSASNVIELASGYDSVSSVYYPHRQLSLPSFSSSGPASCTQHSTLCKFWRGFKLYRKFECNKFKICKLVKLISMVHFHNVMYQEMVHEYINRR